MIGTILGAVASSLAGSLLWRLALLIGAVLLVVWLARRLRHGRDGEPAEGREFGALILLIALAGAVAGLGYGAIDRAAESVRHGQQVARLEAGLLAATQRADALESALQDQRRAAESATRRAAASDRRVIEAQRERAKTTAALRRRVNDVSKDASGHVPVLGPEWVRDYNAALGFFGDVPAVAANPWKSGGPADSAAALDADAAGKPALRPAAGDGSQPAAPGLLAPAPVTTADVLAIHIDNADAARDSATRLRELQDWYNALRAERNGETP